MFVDQVKEQTKSLEDKFDRVVGQLQIQQLINAKLGVRSLRIFLKTLEDRQQNMPSVSKKIKALKHCSISYPN